MANIRRVHKPIAQWQSNRLQSDRSLVQLRVGAHNFPCPRGPLRTCIHVHEAAPERGCRLLAACVVYS